MTSGIYKIENKKTGQIYIGQSIDIEKRFKNHCKILPIDLDIILQGEDNFTFDILEEVPREQLLERERFWINEYDTENEYHYNVSQKGRNNSRSKYKMWNSAYVYYHKVRMCNDNNILCFYVKYKGRYVPIGLFCDFLSCEIIGELIDNFAQN